MVNKRVAYVHKTFILWMAKNTAKQWLDSKSTVTLNSNPIVRTPMMLSERPGYPRTNEGKAFVAIATTQECVNDSEHWWGLFKRIKTDFLCGM